MRRFALAATLSIAALSLAGCKSQQQDQKENAVDSRLSGRLRRSVQKECYDRYPPSTSKHSESALRRVDEG